MLLEPLCFISVIQLSFKSLKGNNKLNNSLGEQMKMGKKQYKKYKLPPEALSDQVHCEECRRLLQPCVVYMRKAITPCLLMTCKCNTASEKQLPRLGVQYHEATQAKE